jgi:hypothetical protein
VWSTDHDLVSASVERGESGDRWETLGAPTTSGGLARYDDGAVTAGRRYGYRLSWAEGQRRESTEIAWVDVPGEPLALRALDSPGTPTLEFTLPAAGRVRLEWLDLRGRRVALRDLGMADAGVHRVGAGPSLRPGVYWARLIVGNDIRQLKLVVL